MLLSPCESCLTLSTPVQYDNEIFTNYLNTRLIKTQSGCLHLEQAQDQDLELIMVYNHHDINIKLASVHNLITTFCKIDIVDLTLNHLFIYFYYTQNTLSFYPQHFLINQINLIHLGKSYNFTLNGIQPKLKDLNIYTYNKFLIAIKPDTQGGSYRDFKLEKYLNQKEVVDQSTGSITFADSIIVKLRQFNTQKMIEKPRIRRFKLKNILQNIHVGI